MGSHWLVSPVRAGWGRGWKREPGAQGAAASGAPAWAPPLLAAPRARPPLVAGPGIVGTAVRQAGPQSQPRAVSSRLEGFLRFCFPVATLRDAPSPSGLCHPLQPRPLAPPYSNTSRRVRDPATRTSASVPSLTLPFRLECLPSLRRPWLPGTTTHLSPAPRRPPPAQEGSPQNPSLPQATSALCKCFCPGTWHPVFHLFTCLSPLLDCESLRAWTVSYASLCFCA